MSNLQSAGCMQPGTVSLWPTLCLVPLWWWLCLAEQPGLAQLCTHRSATANHQCAYSAVLAETRPMCRANSNYGYGKQLKWVLILISINYIIYFMRAALKLMPHILLCWPTASEADVGCMAVEAGSSHQYPITFCCCVTDGSRGAVWHDGVWCGSVYETTVWNWISPFAPFDIHWYLMNVDGDRTVDVSTVRWQVVRFRSGNSDCRSPPLEQVLTGTACWLLFVTGENA